MIMILTLVVIGLVVFSMMREGLFNAICFLFGVVFSGIVAFHFWPVLAGALEDSFQGSIFAHCEDGLALFGVFALTLGLCKLITNAIAYRDLDIPPMISQVGGGVVGAILGYLLAGFIVVALQTLPWDEKFLGYVPPPTDAPSDKIQTHAISNKVFPPDQVWLKLMRRASVLIFKSDDVVTQPPGAGAPYEEFTYEFAKYRRLQPDGKTLERPPKPQPKKDTPVEPKKDENGQVQPTENNPAENKSPEKKLTGPVRDDP